MANASQDFAGQINNRTLVFDYDAEGNLVRASGPAIAGTPNGNNFPLGKTHRYRYISDANPTANWGALSAEQRNFLRHRLSHIWYPNEVQNSRPPIRP